MKIISKLFIVGFIISATGCGSDKPKENAKTLPEKVEKNRPMPSFPEVRKLSTFASTDFLPTLEHKFDKRKNAVYCATLLYAWDEIRKIINSPLNIPKANIDLNLLNASTSFQNVLKPGEFKTFAEVKGDTIKARAEFSKSLPFYTDLINLKNRLKFKNIPVEAFGSYGHSYELSEIIHIRYYKNDNHFLIALQPKDPEHQIYLYLPETTFGSLNEAIAAFKSDEKKGKEEINNQKTQWKYYMEGEDVLIIPKIKFNIETNYSKLEGNEFGSGDILFKILKAWQHTAFILDEKGAIIESEAEMEVAAEEAPVEEEPKPKKMIFDKPFFVFLKRADADNPYFAMWVANEELMIKE